MKNGVYANKHVQANKKCIQTPNRETRMEKIDNHKGPSKRGHIVADTLLLMMLLGRAHARDTK